MFAMLEGSLFVYSWASAFWYYLTTFYAGNLFLEFHSKKVVVIQQTIHMFSFNKHGSYVTIFL